ncbi:MAG: hypothetical protein CVU20_14555 [Betaproteobacteria bacterium HGW-Betaproteobacteria-14]|nr:MAG: hypothetical protein CVU20_14555 [Betaproteobacteria bacterium HGW-Betaproteobacteria-14]
MAFRFCKTSQHTTAPARLARRVLFLAGMVACLQAQPVAAAAPCGEVITIGTHGGSTTRYALNRPDTLHAGKAPVALVLLPGGGGHLDLDDAGCPRALMGNSLVRSIALFSAEGFVTALVDAPSDHPGEDGLAGFRVTTQHADDLGKVIADVRARTGLSVWLVGTSRGAISAANAAARLAGHAAPDGVVLTSPVTYGSRGNKAWVAQSVFDLPLADIRVPLLVVGHGADQCLRSPARLNGDIALRIRDVRMQVVTVTGGPGGTAAPGIDACQGRSPHGFIGQEAEVASGIARFVRGGGY